MKKPSPKSGIRAWESELKKLNATIRKAQRQGIFIEETTIARPKRATEKQVTKLTTIREQIKQRIKSVEEERKKQRQRTPEAIETHTRKGGAGDEEERNARTRYAKPKEDTKLTPEQRAEVRREAARKAAQTRKKHEAEMSPEQRENLRKQRAERFKKAIAKTRKEAAKKAAETRRKKEEAMPPEEREALRKKRTEQLEKNIGRKKDEKDLAPITDEEAPPATDKVSPTTPQEEYYPKEAELVYLKICREIEEVVKYNINDGAAHKLRNLLDTAISENGYVETMRRISTDVDEFEVDCEIILYSSDIEAVERAFNELEHLLLGRALTVDEAKEFEDLYDNMQPYDDLIPLELLEEPPEF